MTFPLLVRTLYQGDSWEMVDWKLCSGDNCPVVLFELERFIDANVMGVPSHRTGHQMKKQKPCWNETEIRTINKRNKI